MAATADPVTIPLYAHPEHAEPIHVGDIQIPLTVVQDSDGTIAIEAALRNLIIDGHDG